MQQAWPWLQWPHFCRSRHACSDWPPSGCAEVGQRGSTPAKSLTGSPGFAGASHRRSPGGHHPSRHHHRPRGR
eukprot:8033874-Alexandrium_andersonii.AAC.1